MTYLGKETSVRSGAPLEFYRFTIGATVWRYASGDLTLTIADPTTPHAYAPEPISRGALDFSQEDEAGALVVTVGRTNAVAQLFVGYPPPGPVTLTIYQKHRNDAEILVAFEGEVASAEYVAAEARLACVPASHFLTRRIPAVLFQSQCNRCLYSDACGVDRGDFGDEAEITAVIGATIESAIFDTRDDGWYVSGYVERANGDRRFIVGHVGEVIALRSPFPDLEVSETVMAYAGCDRTEAACGVAKFDNLLNHLGWPRIPSRNPYGGGSLV